MIDSKPKGKKVFHDQVFLPWYEKYRKIRSKHFIKKRKNFVFIKNVNVCIFQTNDTVVIFLH